MSGAEVEGANRALCRRWAERRKEALPDYGWVVNKPVPRRIDGNCRAVEWVAPWGGRRIKARVVIDEFCFGYQDDRLVRALEAGLAELVEVWSHDRSCECGSQWQGPPVCPGCIDKE